MATGTGPDVRKLCKGLAGMQSIQHMQSGMASMHCNQNMYADRHNCREIHVPGGLAGGEPHSNMARSKKF